MSRRVAACMAACLWTAPAAAASCEAELARASIAHGVPLAVLYAVGLSESGGAKGMRPYAVNVEGKAHYPATLADALVVVETAQARGATLIDVGCMQINLRWHAQRFPNLRAMFDPARNVDYAARFLKELRAREGGWTRAVARYHAGPANHAAQKTYVCRVIAHMAAVGLGAWTPQARELCQPKPPVP
ncbi:MAG: transglycosylase SLT domain-containing protein [Hyphomicrobiales bacterium]|nr:transglycosylase SLT domain-containing protein [Hyphomicrobiales bacterium]